MFELKCYDSRGNSIDGFTQWDVDQSMIIKLESCGDDHIYEGFMSIEPEVHFGNVKREKSLVVRASVVADNEIFVEVPNILLTEPYPLLIYVYYTNPDDASAQATIARTELPIRKKGEPDSYYYVENITNITAAMIKDEVSASVIGNIEETFVEIKDDIDEFKDSVEYNIDTFTGGVNIALNDMQTNLSNELDAAHQRMGNIEELFDSTTKSVNTALENVQAVVDNAAYMKEIIDSSEKDKEVARVENGALYAENLNVKQNIAMGKFVWINRPNNHLALKWIGGDE